MDNIVFMSELDESLNTIYDKVNTTSNYSSDVFRKSSSLSDYFKNLEIVLYPSKANILYTEAISITNFTPKCNGAINFLTESNVSNSYITIYVKENGTNIYCEEFYPSSDRSNWNTFSIPVKAGAKYDIDATNFRKVRSFTIYGVYSYMPKIKPFRLTEEEDE